MVRTAVQDVVKGLLPSGALVSQHVEVGRENVAVRLLSTRGVEAEKIQGAEREIERRSGRRTTLTVATIASQSELAGLMEKLTAPAPPPPPPPVKTLEQIQDELMDRIGPVLSTAWPAAAPLQDFEVDFGPDGIVLSVRYASLHNLDKISIDIITRELQEKLQTANISLVAKRVPPPPQGKDGDRQET